MNTVWKALSRRFKNPPIGAGTGRKPGLGRGCCRCVLAAPGRAVPIFVPPHGFWL